MLRIILTLFVIIFWSLSTFALEDDFSLEQVMSAPLPSNITAAPSGGKIAWVQNSQGLRNIWVAELPDYKGRQLTSYTEDDGQEITNINWSPDAKFAAAHQTVREHIQTQLTILQVQYGPFGVYLWILENRKGSLREQHPLFRLVVTQSPLLIKARFMRPLYQAHQTQSFL